MTASKMLNWSLMYRVGPIAETFMIISMKKIEKNSRFRMSSFAC